MTDLPSLHIGKDEFKAITVGKAQRIVTGTFMERLNEWVILHSPLKLKEKVTFFRLLATMINAGVSLIKALNILQEQTGDAKMKRICQRLAAKIEMGQTLSDGLGEFPNVFYSAEIGMVKSGEASGRLNQVLLTLADEAEKGAKLKRKIKGAMMYPLAIIIVVIGVFIAVTVLVIPKMRATFEEAGASLPSSTKVLIGVSDFLRGTFLGIPNTLLLVLALIGAYILLKIWKKTPNGRFIWDSFLLKIPVFGMLRRKLILAQFARSISTLTQSGISIVKALLITADVVGNETYHRRITLISDDVKQGITIAENIQGNVKMFPSMVVSMIAVGEQTAQIGEVTAKIADFYEDEVDTMAKNLSSLMEPMIIVLIGIVVGYMVTAIMTPVLQLSEVATGI